MSDISAVVSLQLTQLGHRTKADVADFFCSKPVTNQIAKKNKCKPKSVNFFTFTSLTLNFFHCNAI